MKIQKRRITLDETIKSLKNFEHKYGMSSLDFYIRYKQGDIKEELIDDFDATEWVSTYKTFIKLMNEKMTTEVA
jgi:hypothetical protein